MIIKTGIFGNSEGLYFLSKSVQVKEKIGG